MSSRYPCPQLTVLERDLNFPLTGIQCQWRGGRHERSSRNTHTLCSGAVSQIINIPTRVDNILDVVITNSEDIFHMQLRSGHNKPVGTNHNNVNNEYSWWQAWKRRQPDTAALRAELQSLNFQWICLLGTFQIEHRTNKTAARYASLRFASPVQERKRRPWLALRVTINIYIVWKLKIKSESLCRFPERLEETNHKITPGNHRRRIESPVWKSYQQNPSRWNNLFHDCFLPSQCRAWTI